jgi:peptidoglycan/xylan/chitin deacetylase (PgdA/CDA1 family)
MRKLWISLAVLTAAFAAGAAYVAHGYLRASFVLDESRFAELTRFEPAAAVEATAHQADVPILVYHIVRPQYDSDSASVRALALTPETFDAELAHLQESGYHVIGFRDLELYLASSTPLPGKPIIISFDDGWRDQFQYAFPILQKYHDTATFFVFTRAVGRPAFITWDQLRLMVSSGMTIGDHSLSHPYLTKVADPVKLWSEISGSKAELERQLGQPVTEFAYPFGQYNPDIVALVKQAGFSSARGDLWTGSTQSTENLYALSAMNAPTTTATFIKWFP